LRVENPAKQMLRREWALQRAKKKAGARPAFFIAHCFPDYVVERGLTAMTVAGTGSVVGVVSVQPASVTGMQAGRLGLICCESVGGVDEFTSVGMVM
jgi:hypothetical protein